MSSELLGNVRNGIAKGLSAHCRVDRQTPARISALVAQLDGESNLSRGQNSSQSDDNVPGRSQSEPCIASDPKSRPTAERRELNKYLNALAARLPDWMCRTLKWLREPQRWLARLIIAALLVLGGVFSFLPVLGLWMLPLGLVIISQDLTFLEGPLVRMFRWAEGHWKTWRSQYRRWRERSRDSRDG